MRIRQVRPEFWQDEEVAGWPVAVRLFYIGLWGCCDDAGYFEYVPSRIAAVVFPYEPRRRREANVTEWLAFLAEQLKVSRFEGCDHAVVAKLAVHQKTGGAPSYTVKKAHDGESRSESGNNVSNVRVGKDKLGGVTGGTAGAPKGAARGSLPFTFEEVVAATGKPPK